MSSQRFAKVTLEEFELLIDCPASVYKVLLALRIHFLTEDPFPCGARDFESYGIGKDAVASALRFLITRRVIERVKRGSFGVNRNRAVYKWMQAPISNRSPAEDIHRRNRRLQTPAGMYDKTYGRVKSTNQSASPDILKDAVRPSASQPEGRTVASSNKAAEDGIPTIGSYNDIITEAAHDCRIDVADFISKAGGMDRATTLALRYHGSTLGIGELRSELGLPARVTTGPIETSFECSANNHSRAE